MVDINDQVVGAIALNLGQSGQVQSGDLVVGIQPTTEIARYREEYLFYSETVSVPGGGAPLSELGFSFQPPKTERWRVLSVALITDSTVDLEVRQFVLQLGSLTAREVGFMPLPSQAPDDLRRTIVGAGDWGQKLELGGQDTVGFLPMHVDVLFGDEYTLAIRNPAGIFPAAEVRLDIQIIKLPPQRSNDRIKVGTLVVP